MALPIIICAVDLSNAPGAKKILEQNFQVRYVPATIEALCAALPDADAYYASLHVRLTTELLDEAHKLTAIATPTTGIDHIDLDTAAQKGVAILGLKDDRKLLDEITATAELAWALVLAASRYLPAASGAANQGHWARDEYRGHQIAYKTLGILGCGRLGNIVAQYGNAFRMHVIGHDIKQVEIEGVEMVSYDELLRQSDILSVHIHLNEQNRRFVDKRSIKKMKGGAVLINTSRGAIIDETALLEALEKGHLSAAGVDVIDGEWQDNLHEHPMITYARTHDNLIITPHIGGVTYESQEMAFSAAAQKLRDYFAKK